MRILLVVLALTLSAPAQAEDGCLGSKTVFCSGGLTLQAAVLRVGNPHPFNALAGAGVQGYLSLTALDAIINGQTWSVFGLQVAVFGSLISNASGQEFGMLAATVGPCIFNGVGCLGIGHDILRTDGTFGGSLLFTASGNLPFEIIPTSVSSDRSAPRGLTVPIYK